MKNKLLLTLLACGLVFASCDNSSVSPDNKETQSSSVYVFNEGNFSDGNGSVTSIKTKNTDFKVIQQMFKEANGRPIAGIIQTMSAIEGKLYLAINSANKIEVVDAKTFESIATIPMKTTPFDVASASGNTVYVTNLKSQSVSIINIDTEKVLTKTIPVGLNPQNILTVDELTFVANNGYGNAKTISVINNQKNKVVKTIAVGNGPTDLELDKRGRLWVVCNGLIAYDDNFNRVPEKDIPGSIYVIDGETASVIDSISLNGHPIDMAINSEKNLGYLLKDGVYLVNTGSVSLANKLIDRTFNAVSYSANKNLIYTAVNKGYTQPGKVIRYDLQGAAVDSFPAGIAPSGFFFLNTK